MSSLRNPDSVPRRLLRYTRPLLLGHPLHGRERYGVFTIVGSGRCGTTLMRAMLEAHPALHVPPGNVMLRGAIQDYRSYSRLPWSPLLRLVLTRMAFHESWETFGVSLGDVFRAMLQRPARARNLAAVLNAVYRGHLEQHKPSATRWGDKSPFGVLGLRDVAAVFPDVRVIHLLRDGRDVAASFADAFGDDLPRAAMVWLRAVAAAHAFRSRRPAQYLEVRYEELVTGPEAVLRRVAAFLDIEFDERMLRHHAFDLRLGDVERTPYMQGVREPVHPTSVGRWRKAFTAAQSAELHRLLGPTLRVLGYENGS